LAAHKVPKKKPSEKKNAAIASAIRMRFIQICLCIEISVAKLIPVIGPFGISGELPHDRTDGANGRRRAKMQGNGGGGSGKLGLIFPS
jgi:hypothetical protein